VLSEQARPGAVHLRVSHVGGSLEFWQDQLGLEARTAGEATALHAAGASEPLIVLHAAGGPRRSAGRAGLYHVALRVPARRDLARVLLRLGDAGVVFQGAADHGVSEALYLADPEGNGVELYVDRPGRAWTRPGDTVEMTTLPLDVQGLVAEANGDPAPLPVGSDVGHVHLQVDDLQAAEAFYGPEGLGLDVTTRAYPGALFLSAGGYHHHLGLNTWGVRGPGSADALGLLAWTLMVPEEGVEEAAERVGAAHENGAWQARDPAGNLLRLVAASTGRAESPPRP
jgi:catechol 2,3-dioxygenase